MTDQPEPSIGTRAGFVARLLADIGSIVERGDAKTDLRLAWRRCFAEALPRPRVVISIYPGDRLVLRFDDGRWEIRRMSLGIPSMLERRLDAARSSGKNLLDELFKAFIGDGGSG